ncbi:MAG: MFS transporter [Deinococcales bacterium]
MTTEDPPGPTFPPAATRRWVLAAATLGSSMVFLDNSTVNVALPALQHSLGASVVDVQWVINAYTLFLASLLLLGGALGDLLGRRRVFAVGVGVFTLASIACGLSANTGMLIASRAAQGIGGALLTPGSLALINGAYPREERGQAIGLWSGFSAIASATGPVLGGYLIDTLSWRGVFFLNVPLALAVLAVTWLRMPATPGQAEVRRLDVAGALTAVLGLGGVVYALIESSKRGFGAPSVLAALVGGVAVLGAFLVIERRLRRPMVPLELFASRPFAGANVLTLFLYAALSGLLFFLPMNLIEVQGYTATAAGAALLPFVVSMFLLSRWSGGLVARVGARPPLVVGPLVVALAFLLYARSGGSGSYWSAVFPAVLAQGIGMAVSVAPLTTTVMASVPEARAATASGINNAVSRVAGLLAIGAFGAVMVGLFGAHLEARLPALGLPAQAVQTVRAERTDLAALAPPSGLTVDQAVRLRRAVDAAFVHGFRVVMLAFAGLAVAASGVAYASLRGSLPAAPPG